MENSLPLAPWWVYVVGFAFSLGIGSIFTRFISNALWTGIGWRPEGDPLRPHPEHAGMVGVVERALYTTSFLMGNPEFVAVWLALKVAGQWSRWSSVVTFDEGDNRKVAGRAIFNVFLIGNAFSIAFGLTGGLLVQSLASPILEGGFWIAAGLLLGSFAFWGWASSTKAAV